MNIVFPFNLPVCVVYRLMERVRGAFYSNRHLRVLEQPIAGDKCGLVDIPVFRLNLVVSALFV